MKLPAIPFGASTVAGLIEWLRQLAASVAAAWGVEHKADGRHDWHWKTPTFDASRFQANGALVWTVGSDDIVVEEYGRQGDLMVWTLEIQNTSTSGSAASQLRIMLPDGLRVKTRTTAMAEVVNAGATATAGYVRAATAGDRYVFVRPVDNSSWSATASDNTYVAFSMVMRVQ